MSPVPDSERFSVSREEVVGERRTIVIGPFEFVYDASTHEMFLNVGEEQVGYVDHVWDETWAAFVGSVRRPE